MSEKKFTFNKHFDIFWMSEVTCVNKGIMERVSGPQSDVAHALWPQE